MNNLYFPKNLASILCWYLVWVSLLPPSSCHQMKLFPGATEVGDLLLLLNLVHAPGPVPHHGLAPRHVPLHPLLLRLLYTTNSSEELKLPVVAGATCTVAKQKLVSVYENKLKRLPPKTQKLTTCGVTEWLGEVKLIENLSLLVQIHLVLVVPVPEEPLTLGEAITVDWPLPVLHRPLLEEAELLPCGTLANQVPLQPGLGTSVLPVNQSHH